MHHTTAERPPSAGTARHRCPGPEHATSGRRHCEGKHCIERRSNLLVLWWTHGSLLTCSDILQSFVGLRELSDGDVLPLVVHLQSVSGYLREARDVVAESSLNSRVAFLGAGPVDRVIAAFAEPGFTETRYFECPDEAEAWARAA